MEFPHSSNIFINVFNSSRLRISQCFCMKQKKKKKKKKKYYYFMIIIKIIKYNLKYINYLKYINIKILYKFI